jgi:hypothetical protein
VIKARETTGTADRMTAPAWAVAAPAAALLVLTVAACGGDDESSADTTDDTEGAAVEAEETTSGGDDTTTTAAATPDEQAVAAYEAAWEAMFTASNPPNPQHPVIGESLTGAAAQWVVGVVIEQQNNAQHTVGSMRTDPQVVSSTASEVRIRDCTVEDSTTYRADGSVVESGLSPPRPRVVTVVNQDGTWRVSEIQTPEETCTP